MNNFRFVAGNNFPLIYTSKKVQSIAYENFRSAANNKFPDILHICSK
jgi:hypothetical protein